jgi:parvulin-like peptidyl-prolyl isomerase
VNRTVSLLVLTAIAIVAGLAASALLCRSAAFRDLAGRLAGRGHLLAITDGKGVYKSDLDAEEEVLASDLVAAQNLRSASANEQVEPARIDREMALLQAQFGEEKSFREAYQASGLSISSLREKVAVQLRAIDWLEKQIAPSLGIAEEKCRQFYNSHPELFTQPVRFRASHLFLAAHAETPPEVVEEKELSIAALATRLENEPLSGLATEASEDEATKKRGGDLAFFSERGIPPEFAAELQKLGVGETSKPFRSHLGFHIAQLTDTKPSRLLTFEEVRPEISLALANDRRAAIASNLAETLSRPQ